MFSPPQYFSPPHIAREGILQDRKAADMRAIWAY